MNLTARERQIVALALHGLGDTSEPKDLEIIVGLAAKLGIARDLEHVARHWAKFARGCREAGLATTER